MSILETARLRLVALAPDHISTLVDLWSDPDVTRFMGGPRDRATLPAAFVEDLGNTDTFGLWPVVFRANCRTVGYAGIIRKPIAEKDEYELIYVFAKNVWGRGLGSEIADALIGHAMNKLRITRLVALIDPENNASAHVAIKTGFVLERSVTRDDGHIKHLYARNLAKPESDAS